jgi:hypothetical protein
MPIFTIVFQTLDVRRDDNLIAHQPISAEKTLLKVRDSADAALSNALLDLYVLEMEARLYQHYASVEERIRKALSEEFLKREEFGTPFFIKCWSAAGTLVFVLALLAALILTGIKVYEFIQPMPGQSTNPSPGARPSPASPSPTDKKLSPAPAQPPAVTR